MGCIATNLIKSSPDIIINPKIQHKIDKINKIGKTGKTDKNDTYRKCNITSPSFSPCSIPRLKNSYPILYENKKLHIIFCDNKDDSDIIYEYLNGINQTAIIINNIKLLPNILTINKHNIDILWLDVNPECLSKYMDIILLIGCTYTIMVCVDSISKSINKQIFNIYDDIVILMKPIKFYDVSSIINFNIDKINNRSNSSKQDTSINSISSDSSSDISNNSNIIPIVSTDTDSTESY